MPVLTEGGPARALGVQMLEAVEFQVRPEVVDRMRRVAQWAPIDADLSRLHIGMVGCPRDLPYLPIRRGTVHRLAEPMERTISDEIGLAMVGQAGDSRAMLIHTFRAMERPTIEGEILVITTGGSTVVNRHADGVEAPASKRRAEGKSQTFQSFPFFGSGVSNRVTRPLYSSFSTIHTVYAHVFYTNGLDGTGVSYKCRKSN